MAELEREVKRRVRNLLSKRVPDGLKLLGQGPDLVQADVDGQGQEVSQTRIRE